MKVIKVLLLILLVKSVFLGVYASNVVNIEVENDKKINLTLTDDVKLTGSTLSGSTNLKILKDVGVESVDQDAQSDKKVVLNLLGELKLNTNYKLFSILGLDGDIDFSINDSFDNIEIINSEVPSLQGIVKIVILNSKRIEVYFNKSLNNGEFEFKVLNEIFTDNISIINDNSLSVKMKDKIEGLSDYMIMFLSLEDNTGKEITFNENLYEFKTLTVLASPNEENLTDIGNVTSNEISNENNKISDENNKINEDSKTTLEGNLEKVAKTSAKIDVGTGPETWIIFIPALLVAFFLFLFLRFRRNS